MNCPKCNSTLREGAKFCSSCGTPVIHVNASIDVLLCSKCSAPLKPNAKFCAGCGAKIDFSPVTTPEEVQIIKRRICWNVQPGEIARKINETEFMQYDSALGFIVNDGTTAHIRCDGKQIAEVKGGIYDFIDPNKVNEILESRTGKIPGAIKNGFRWCVNLILGEKVKDRIFDIETDPTQQKSLDALLECMKENTLLSVILKLDKDFELIFGSSHSNPDGYADYTPMSIKTKYLDVEIGLRVIFKITEFHQFAHHFLADKAVVTLSDIANTITPIVKAAVQEVLFDVEQYESKLSSETINKISNKIRNTLSGLMYGIGLGQIVEISSKNEDLDRFRALSRELYLSEKELDYLNRTNDFKNRLSTLTADQTIYEEQGEFDLKKRLDEINKDKLLHDDELDRFVQALFIDKKIRAARTQQELNATLLDLEKQGLINEDDCNKLKDVIRKGEYDRELSFEIMQIQGVADKNRAQTDVEKAELERVRQQRLTMADIEVQEQKLRDDYVIDRQTRSKSAELDQEEREMNARLDMLSKLKGIENLNEEQKHKRELENTQQEQDFRLKEMQVKYSNAQHLSPEQLMAIAANENLSAEASIKFAESFSLKMNSQQQAEFMEQIMKLNQARIDDRDRAADRMEQMFYKVLETNQAMTGHLVRNEENRSDEYKERLTRQEDRIDQTQDKALDYTTRSNKQVSPAQSNTPKPGKTCPNCNSTINQNEQFCGNCGNAVE